jgi:hypothetical protein
MMHVCPTDNYLTIFYRYLKDYLDVFNQLALLSNNEYLTMTVSLFSKGEFAIGKVHWLKQFPQFDFSVSATVDVWGSEQDMRVIKPG